MDRCPTRLGRMRIRGIAPTVRSRRAPTRLPIRREEKTETRAAVKHAARLPERIKYRDTEAKHIFVPSDPTAS